MSLQPNEAKDQANWNLRAYSGEPRLGPPSACSSRREPMPRIAGRIAAARLHLRLIGSILNGSAAGQPAHILTTLAHESLGWHLD